MPDRPPSARPAELGGEHSTSQSIEDDDGVKAGGGVELSLELVRAANRLTARWAGDLPDGSSALSGVGLWPLLALLAAGSAGPARSELAAAIGRPADGAELAARDLLRMLSSSPSTEAALGVWARAGIPFTPWWTATLPPGAGGLLTGDCAVDQATLDTWAQERTQGLIKAMPIEVATDTLMVLATAVTVRTVWSEPLRDTPWRITTGPWAGERPIAGLTGTTRQLDRISVADTPAGPLTLLALPGNQDVDVHLALGEPGRAAAEVLPAALSALAGDHPQRTGAELPLGPAAGPGLLVEDRPATSPEPVLSFITTRFTVRATHDLLARARLFGLQTATGPGRHFTLISPEPLVLDQAVQEVVAIFTAEGFQAAAVTAFGFRMGMRVPQHVARTIQASFDRPFGFVVTHRPTGLVLFTGWVADPEPLPPTEL